MALAVLLGGALGRLGGGGACMLNGMKIAQLDTMPSPMADRPAAPPLEARGGTR